jgi:hypothetical protein
VTPETTKIFLRQYVASLSEETQRTKAGDRFGFDYLIEQLGAAEKWILHRAPSHPAVQSEDLPTPKKEAEHGVDYAFLTPDRQTLIIFVLKDEKLTYRNFTVEKFDFDLRRAAQQDLTVPELTGVTVVRVVLAYNKSDEEEGVEDFDRLVKTLGTKVGDHAKLTFERWNLDRLVEEIEAKLFTPAMLPPNFFRALTYICAQVGDFSHGSSQWEAVLVPDWKEFLERVLADPISPRSVWMVAVALPIVQQHGKQESAFETGWIELLEWAVLALWHAALRAKSLEVSEAVREIWLMGYARQLERFYTEHSADLGVEDSLARNVDPGFEPVIQSYLAHWHLARLGLLWHCFAELKVKEEEKEIQAALEKRLHEISTWIQGLNAANPGALRPLLDSHHIELYLVWSVFYGLGQTKPMFQWLNQLYERIVLRRREGGPFRVIANDNEWESVFEMVIEKEPPLKSYGRTSYLLLMLEEMCFALPEPMRETLLSNIHEHIVLGRNSRGESLEYDENIELASWAPPAGWELMTLTGTFRTLDDVGVAITTGNFERHGANAGKPIVERVRDFMLQCRARYPLKRETNLPLSVLLLACVKHRTPLAPDFWRASIFDPPNGPSA